MMLFPADIANKYKSYFKDLGLITIDKVLKERVHYSSTSFLDLAYFDPYLGLDNIDVLFFEHYDSQDEEIYFISEHGYSLHLTRSFFLEKSDQVYIFFKDDKSAERFLKYAHRAIHEPVEELSQEHRSFLIDWFKYEIRKKGL